MNYQSVIKKHLKAIQQKDLASFSRTLSKIVDVSVVMPNGHFVEGYEKVIDFHKDWFQDPDWTFQYTMVREEISRDMGYSVVKVNYDDRDQNGEPYNKQYYLTLVFRKMTDSWYLVHDQNTFMN
ncbi:YybH family protein [Pseudalkalibacillus salsuginis]|uniref:YybH family protein n=1 Tax=Pseudalkalibacillus salsuginis TaxID=2910972 RepID=UPI001F2A0DA2|nr:nuclear transport factor 2 family protein [Pseudalkalibacillus salsuginis]MCF6409793.1 nuclear transport factor 2 family protein [Pseudalkalibacillus salsuginis]